MMLQATDTPLHLRALSLLGMIVLLLIDGAIAPSRRSDLARIGMRAMIAGSLAGFMTATIAGMLV